MQTQSELSVKGVRLRRAKADDADVLTELCICAKRSNGYDELFMAKCREELTVTQERLLKGEYWVAEANEICGCACLDADHESNSGEVHSFFIDPDWQRKGIGQLLWHKILQRAKVQSLEILHLHADPFAVPFYSAMGFTLKGDVPSGSIDGRQLPHMIYKIVSA